MEKRLGVAQLCLLLAVLVFMGLTRGSRGSVFEDRRHWRGTLKSISGDWSRPRLKASEDLQVPRGKANFDHDRINIKGLGAYQHSILFLW
jgi:hypothetical protein